MNLSQDILLQDDRVLLRPLQTTDLPHLAPFSEQEPEIWTYSLMTAAGTEHMRQYIELAVQAREAGREYPFIVWDKTAQAWAGSTRFYDIQPQHQTLQLGFTWYGKAFQGTGLNAHCKYLMLQLAFDTLGMARVEFRADANNARSIAAMKAIGCTVEGILRSNCARTDGGRRDSIILSILRSEWDSHVRDLLLRRMHNQAPA